MEILNQAMIGKKYTCICIDDDKLFIEIISTMIDELNYLDLLETFNNPIQGLMKVDQLKPDIIFLDMDMPEINGWTFMDALDYDPIIVVISSHWEYEQGISEDGYFFIPKPLKNPEQISNALKDVL